MRRFFNGALKYQTMKQKRLWHRVVTVTIFVWLSWLLVACGNTSPEEILELIVTPTAVPTEPPPPTATAVPAIAPYSLVGFQDFLQTAENSRLADRQELVNDYMAQVSNAPLVDTDHAIFLWQGAAQSVHLHGDMNNWITEASLPYTHIEATDLWYVVLEVEPAARLDYQLIIDAAQLTLDPLNPRQIPSPVGNRSVLQMGDYETPRELRPPISPLTAEQRGSLTTHTLESDVLTQTRTIVVYTPAQAPTTADGLYPTVYVQDGSDYINLIDMPSILDRLIAAGDIPPLVAVFIPPINRYAEYDHSNDYVNFMADELAPFVQRTYGTSRDAAQTAVLGADMGGLIAIHATQAQPDRFGAAASHSGTLANGQNKVLRQFDFEEAGEARYHIVVGSYETAVGGDDREGDLLAVNRRLEQTLQRNNYLYSYAEYPEGHSWGFWQAHIGSALTYFFGD